MVKRKKRKPNQATKLVAAAPAAVEPMQATEDEQVAHWVAQREAVRRTTTKIVLLCILVGLATAAVMLAGGGSSP